MSKRTFLLEQFKKAQSVCTDTRKIKKGDLYFALKGDQFDGNTFASKALEQGCVLAVVDDPTVVANDTSYVLVDDVLTSLQELAHDWRKTFDIPVLGITGSNGKTTTKELVRDALGATFRVHATYGNLNNHIGVPLTLLSMPKDTEIAIIEMGANHQGEIAALCDIAHPTHGYITNVGLAHLEGFGGEEGVRKGKKELFDFISSAQGHVFLSGNDSVVTEMAVKNKAIYFQHTNAEYLASLAIRKSGDSMLGEVNYALVGKAPRSFPTQLTGDYNAQNMAAALAIALHFDVPVEAATQALSIYTPDNSRSQVVQTDLNTVIQDAYNANPTSMRHALLNLAEASGAKLAILGDMKEVGDTSNHHHKEIIALLDEYEITGLLIGPEFGACTISEPHLWFENADEASRWLSEENPSQFTILLKGSNSMKLNSLMTLL